MAVQTQPGSASLPDGLAAPREFARSWQPGAPGRAPGRTDADGWTVAAVASLNILAAMLLGFLAQVAVVGTLTHNRDQQVAYDDLRLSLAEGTGPVGPVQPGTPVARLAIPAIGLKEVVLEGTASGVLRSGVGHRRDTVLPGQAGVSILMGRRTAYGGPFSQLGELKAGDSIEVTTGQGTAKFRVIGKRLAGDPGPPDLAAGGSRITFMTSAGPRFAPDGVLRVDADRESPGVPGEAPALSTTDLPRSERELAREPGALTPAAGWGMVLTLAAVATAWLRARWGRWQAWVVAIPTLGLLGITVADHTARLLPNLM